METKFNEFINESRGTWYGISNIFSEGHRKYLNDNSYMVDIDALYTLDGKINVVMEDKYKFESRMSKYQIIDVRSWQRKVLRKFAAKINSHFVILEERSRTYLRVNERNEDIPTKIPYNNKKLVQHATANNMYLEIRGFGLNIKSVMYIKDTIDPIVINEIKQHYRTLEISLDGKDISINEDGKIYKIKPEDKESWMKQYSYLKLLY